MNSGKRRLLAVLLLFVVLFCLGITTCAFAESGTKPIITVTSPSRGVLLVKSSNATAKDGYQIIYSPNADLSKGKTVTVKTSDKLNKKINSLSLGKKYYVKARMYRLSNNKKLFGPWSAVQSRKVKAYTVAYVMPWKINLESSKKTTNKWSTNPLDYTAPYMAEVKVYAPVGTYSKSQWVKLGYKGKTRYTYINVSTENRVFTTKRSIFTYDNYEKYCTTDLQKKILKRAMEVYGELPEFPIKYDQNHTTYRVGDGKRNALDCSNFARYIVNEVLGGDYVAVKPAYIWGDAKENKVLYDERGKKITIEKIGYSNLQPGDIVCFDDNLEKGEKEYDYVDHVGVYIGNNEFVHSTNALAGGVSGVKISPISGKYYKSNGIKRFIGAGRITVK